MKEARDPSSILGDLWTVAGCDPAALEHVRLTGDDPVLPGRFRVGTVNASAESASLIRPRYLFVVSRQHRFLYELLVERFQDDKNVEVILDRRAATRGTPAEYGTDRRRRPRNELSVRSHLIVTRSD